MQWMHDFSDVGNAISCDHTLNLMKAHSHQNEKCTVKRDSSVVSDFDDFIDDEEMERHIVGAIKKADGYLGKMGALEFNIFDLNKKVKRDEVLPIIAYNCLTGLKLKPLFQEDKMLNFVEEI